jgi:hypothetical protein
VAILLASPLYGPERAAALFTWTDVMAVASSRTYLAGLLEALVAASVPNTIVLITKCRIPDGTIETIKAARAAGLRVLVYLSYSGLDSAIEVGIRHEQLVANFPALTAAGIPVVHYWRPAFPASATKETMTRVVDLAAGIREAHEELGLRDLTYSDFVPLGIRQTAVTLAPAWIEREFQHWHLLPYEGGLESIPLDDAEVSGLVEVNLHDAIPLAAGERDQIDARYMTRDDHGQPLTAGHLGTADLIPGYLAIDRLYLRLFLAAHHYIRGDRQHLFW